ncbi:heme peroxidase [Apiospora rasikravindrae]|uniref:Heme peroxidase n=1 Tax=Apiospora rasikravindrae TaxID=990691 RepID=A0ABR1SIQ9_9PEZI
MATFVGNKQSIGAGQPPSPIHPGLPTRGNLPDAALVFETLLARGVAVRDNPNQVSSLFLHFAALISMDRSGSCGTSGPNHTSKPRLRLLPLYGKTTLERAGIRQFQNGLLKDDKFASSEAWLLPPGVRLLLVMFNRFHNYIATGLLALNESNRFPAHLRLAEKDEVVYQLARRITCLLYVNIILNDYLRTLLGVNKIEAECTLKPGSISRGSFLNLRIASKTRRDDTYEAAMGLIVDNWWKNALSENNDYISTPCSRSTCRTKPPKADGAASSTDEEMANGLRRSVQDTASAFGANRVPVAFRYSQINAIVRARKQQLPTLNTFRKSMGLPVHKTFQDINTSPLITAKLRTLYATPDEVELYPGMVAEQPRPKAMVIAAVVGKWLWTGSTVTHAVMHDILASIRGDLFYTDEWSAESVTSWGGWMYYRTVLYNRFHEAASDKTVDYGCVMHKLFLRAFPKHFTADSVYTHFPFVTPAGNRAILAELGSDVYYSFQAANGTTSVPATFSLTAIASYAHPQERLLDLTGILESSNAMLTNALKQLQSVLGRSQNTPSHKPTEIDLVELIIAPYLSQLFCSRFSMLLSRTKADGLLTTTEVWQAMKSIHEPACNLDPVYALELNKKAREAMEKLRVHYVKSKKARIQKSLRERLLHNWPDSQDVDHSVCPAIKMVAHQLVSIQQVLVESVEYFLADGRGHLRKLQQLSLYMNDGHPNCATNPGVRVLHYLLEGYRLYLAANGRNFRRKTPRPDPNFTNVSISSRNHNLYPKVSALVLDRDLNSYENIGVGKALLSLLQSQPILTLFLELATFSRWEVVDSYQGRPRRINIPNHHWGIAAGDRSADASEADWDLVEAHEHMEDSSWIAVSNEEVSISAGLVETRESRPQGEVTVTRTPYFIMACKFFTKDGPVELIVHIMSLCDSPSDTESLAATCRSTREIWLANRPTIIWHVWPQADLALTAVRATKLVQEAEERGELPPKDMDPGKLSGSVVLPTPEELESMSRLQALVDKLEVAFCLDTWELKKVSTTPAVYKKCPRLRENVRKAVFRVFISGAVLAGAYIEPFHEAKRTGLAQVNDLHLLKDFLLYNPYIVSEAKVSVFERLALWLVDDILSDSDARRNLETRISENGRMKRRCSSARPCASKSPGKDDCISRHLIECNVMQMIWVYRHMWKTMNPTAQPFDWKSSSVLALKSLARLRNTGAGARALQDDPDKVPIVLFGRFQVEKVAISRILSRRYTLGHLGSPDPYVLSNIIIDMEHPRIMATIDFNQSVMTLLSWAYRFTPPPGDVSHQNKLPLDFAFFDHVLKQYAAVQMKTRDAQSLVSPVRLLGNGSEIARFLWTFNDFLGSEEQFHHRTPLRPPRYVNNCLLMRGFGAGGFATSKCKHIGATVHLAASKCPHC